MFRRYLVTLVASAAFVIVACGTTNFAVDPFGRIRAGLPLYYGSERDYKPTLLRSSHFDGLIIGSSKSAYIPTDSLAPPAKVINASFSGAVPEEIWAFIRDMQPQVRWIALELDLFMFNATMVPYNPQRTFRRDLWKEASDLLSFDFLSYSLRTMVYRATGRPSRYSQLGARDLRDAESKDQDNPLGRARVLAGLSDNHFRDYRIAWERFEDLKRIQQYTDSHGITLVVWLNPLERDVLRLVKSRTDPAIVAQKCREIFHHFVDLSDKYPNPDDYWKGDPFHYYPTVGMSMLKRDVLPMITANAAK